ncbi:LysR family transcriptional regulator [Murimonas intestini]|uniref:LysR family transcriptional regulator n=1 Tax=Murimonas intestini TaxID=1337051 RepID=A0AB73TA84_9FIRM|nr:LysR family transcriptional regulator [Murimonas intestini]MCR1839012.1 LysR family transcriptional regulator [Murimonas intestini]MCR1864308.1 LysR family transcriptional regulator [Murimonas intestini]MCR1881918.1 LysR family transcriptional regulator [Murimonas intestini]
MDIRVLQYFLAVAREENITAAAESLHMTQPPLSRQLRELEEELGKTLFIRGKRKITLTQEGLILRKRAEEMIELMEKTTSEIRSSSKHISGDIYIGSAETDAMRLVIRTIKSIQQDYPEIRFHISSGHAEDIEEKLDRGLLDFGIFIEPAAMQKYDFIKLPAADTWGVLMRKDSPLAAKASIRPEDLFDLPLIFTNQELASNEFAGWSGGEYDRLNIIATYNLPYMASLMVEENVGYALVLDKIIQTAEGCPLCFRPLEPKLEVSIIVGWKRYQVFSRASEVFLNLLQQDITLNIS